MISDSPSTNFSGQSQVIKTESWDRYLPAADVPLLISILPSCKALMCLNCNIPLHKSIQHIARWNPSYYNYIIMYGSCSFKWSGTTSFIIPIFCLFQEILSEISKYWRWIFTRISLNEPKIASTRLSVWCDSLHMLVLVLTVSCQVPAWYYPTAATYFGLTASTRHCQRTNRSNRSNHVRQVLGPEMLEICRLFQTLRLHSSETPIPSSYPYLLQLPLPPTATPPSYSYPSLYSYLYLLQLPLPPAAMILHSAACESLLNCM